MPPDSNRLEKVLLYNNVHNADKPTQVVSKKQPIVVLPILLFVYTHLTGLYGLYLCFTSAKWATLFFAFLMYVAAEIGITAGAHRLWSHNSFKAKMPLQILLMIMSTCAYQNTISHWVRDHRQHHKYADTDGDPHSASRGFFYSYVGWLFTKKSKEVLDRGNKIDMTDIKSNPVLQFQEKYELYLVAGLVFLIPTVIPAYFWGESLVTAWHVNMLRYVVNLQISFLANSICHRIGYRPYDKNMAPTNNLFINWIVLGDGFHNFHHAFPYDYQGAESGNQYLNQTKWFIDFFAWIGWAYDLKTVPEKVVEMRRKRTGDKTDLWGRMDENVKDKQNKIS